MEVAKNFGFCSHVKEGLWLKSRVMSLIHDIFRTYISPFPQQFLDLRWEVSPNTIVTAVLKFHWLQETSWLSFVVVVLQSHKRGKGREKELVEFSCWCWFIDGMSELENYFSSWLDRIISRHNKSWLLSKDQGVHYLVVLITVIGKVFYETGRLLL